MDKAAHVITVCTADIFRLRHKAGEENVSNLRNGNNKDHEVNDMKFTQIPADTFAQLQLNAGILCDSFTPATGTVGNIIGATTGGITFASNPTFSDWGEDIDNCPNNTKQLKRITAYDPAMSGTFLTVTGSSLKQLVGAGVKTEESDVVKVTPTHELVTTDFTDLWWIGDYSDINTGSGAGFLAIHLIDALNTGSFQIKSTKNAKGNFAFDFHGHYNLDDPDTVPFELYMMVGEESSN